MMMMMIIVKKILKHILSFTNNTTIHYVSNDLNGYTFRPLITHLQVTKHAQLKMTTAK